MLMQPYNLELKRQAVAEPGPGDVVVKTHFSGISSGTERLLWSGRMPTFPGHGYPLILGYETAGEVVEAGADSGYQVGDWVFVPGANCFPGVTALFGGAASHLVSAGSRIRKIPGALGEKSVLLALAATAKHVIGSDPTNAPELIVGHGVFGRLLARIALAIGAPAPTVWELNQARMDAGEFGGSYAVVTPADDPRKDYKRICDASGNADVLDDLIARLGRHGEIVLAGFYDQRPSFSFPPAFMREARLRIVAEWTPEDLDSVTDLINSGALNLDDLISHHEPITAAPHAYEKAFTDRDCLKMVIDWRAGATETKQ
ncbi:MAG: chlorophyll synthesis pathway protein BchC [Burkholderiaceae bacterium]